MEGKVEVEMEDEGNRRKVKGKVGREGRRREEGKKERKGEGDR